MHKIQIDGYTRKTASSWDELSLKDIRLIARNFNRKATENDLKTRVMLQLLGLRVLHRRPVLRDGEECFPLKAKKHKPFLVTGEQLADMLKTLDFLTAEIKKEDETVQRIISSWLTKQKLPWFRYRFKKYYGPETRLFNILFDEFLEADQHFLAFTRTHDDNDLNKLVATLYRPADKRVKPGNINYTGDRRETFNDNLVEYRAKKLRRVPVETKLIILFFYQGCREFLKVNFPAVFSESTGKKGRNYGPLELVDALTNEDVTKKPEKEKLYKVMVRLQKSADKYEEMKKNLKK